jgi:hypothetical protein
MDRTAQTGRNKISVTSSIGTEPMLRDANLTGLARPLANSSTGTSTIKEEEPIRKRSDAHPGRGPFLDTRLVSLRGELLWRERLVKESTGCGQPPGGYKMEIYRPKF